MKVPRKKLKTFYVFHSVNYFQEEKKELVLVYSFIGDTEQLDSSSKLFHLTTSYLFLWPKNIIKLNYMKYKK